MIFAKSVSEYASLIPEEKRPVFDALRSILIDIGFDEQIKWRMPVYTIAGRNAIGLGITKHTVSLWFYEGHRIDDHLHVLINAQEGKTKAMRHWKFQALAELDEDHIRDYLTQAIDIAQNPIKEAKTVKKTIIPKLLNLKLEGDPTLKAAFLKFTPYKQREFCEHIETAKRDATKEKRLAAILPLILSGTGLGDKYRK